MNGRILSVGGFLCFFGMSTVWAGALHQAASHGDIAQLQELLADGGDLDAQDSSGETPLTLASLGGHLEIVQALIDRGANIQARNDGGLSPLHAAAYGGHAEVALWLVEHGAQVNDASNFYDASPLHLAAEENHKAVVELLLAHDAEIEARERNGYTPLTQAGWREYWDVADVLMKAGASCQPADLVGEWLHAECTKRQ